MRAGHSSTRIDAQLNAMTASMNNLTTLKLLQVHGDSKNVTTYFGNIQQGGTVLIVPAALDPTEHISRYEPILCR